MRSVKEGESVSNKINLKIITPEKLFFEGDVDMYAVNAKGATGGFAVWTNHSPLTSEIGYGTISLYEGDVEIKKATLFGGFALVQPYETIILVDAAEWPEDIDVERATKAKEKAEAEMAKGDENFEQARIALMKASARLELANTAKK